MSARSATLSRTRPAKSVVPEHNGQTRRVQKNSAPDPELALLLLDEARQGMLLVDDALFIEFTNRTFVRMFPHAAVEIGTSIRAHGFHPELAAVASQSLSSGLRTMAQLRMSEGGEVIYRVEASPLNLRERSVCLLIIEDITEQSHTEQIRKDFVTNASHELRTPLALIHGYIETLQSGMFKGAASMQRCLEVMDKHSRRMMRIIEDMLTISRLEGSDGQLKFEPFHIRGCVEDVLEHLTPLIDLRQPDIKIDLPVDGVINGDRFYWDQIFTNLLENALKENVKPGLVLTVSGEWSEQAITLTVTDNGVGIPTADIPFVFKRFFRCAKHHSQEIKGTGLGLSIVKRAVEAHGGKVSVQSTPGVETTFTMTLPVVSA